MTARTWTVEELDIVHQLPDGWSWVVDEDVEWYVKGPYVKGPQNTTVCVTNYGDVAALALTESFSPPADVALAVILASKGLDSREAIAEAIEHRAEGNHKRGDDPTVNGGYRMAALAKAVEGLDCAEMVRRGRVSP